MCKEFDENLRVLADVIYSEVGEFTEEKIAREYKKRTGFLMVNASISVSGFLKDLRDLGSLSLHAGKYQVIRHP